MNRRTRRERQDVPQLFRRNRAKTVRRYADDRIRNTCDSTAARLDEPAETLHVIREARLLRTDRLAAEIAVGIEDRQQRERDTTRRRSGNDALAHFREIRVRRALHIVMHVVKFADAREARLEHLDES